MINNIIEAGIFLLIGLLIGYILGIGSGPDEDVVNPYEVKSKPRKSKREGFSQGPVYTETKGKPTIHVVTPKSPAEVEFDRRNKKPDLMKPE